MLKWQTSELAVTIVEMLILFAGIGGVVLEIVLKTEDAKDTNDDDDDQGTPYLAIYSIYIPLIALSILLLLAGCCCYGCTLCGPFLSRKRFRNLLEYLVFASETWLSAAASSRAAEQNLAMLSWAFLITAGIGVLLVFVPMATYCIFGWRGFSLTPVSMWMVSWFYPKLSEKQLSEFSSRASARDKITLVIFEFPAFVVSIVAVVTTPESSPYLRTLSLIRLGTATLFIALAVFLFFLEAEEKEHNGDEEEEVEVFGTPTNQRTEGLDAKLL